MAGTSQRILADALTLPEKERLELASEIIASVDGQADPDWDAAWLKELDARAAVMRTGDDPGEDWATVRARIMKRHSRT
jgi:putative addiction module component (TIGR02574 family)